jgi:hypothetical protein
MSFVINLHLILQISGKKIDVMGCWWNFCELDWPVNHPLLATDPTRAPRALRCCLPAHRVRHTALFAWLISHHLAVLSFRTKQPPATSLQYFSLRTNQHQLPATIQTNRLVHQPPMCMASSSFPFTWMPAACCSAASTTKINSSITN